MNNENFRLIIWVISVCNLSCRLCGMSNTINQNHEYQMSMEEVDMIVESIKRRNIKIHVIELSGGEPTMWPILKEASEKFKTVCDELTLITNGNTPQKIIDLNLPRWAVSSSQANSTQLDQYKPYNHKIVYNNHQHVVPPEDPIKGVLPASCCVRSHPFTGQEQNSIFYQKGKVYYCCFTNEIKRKVPITDDLVCDFEEDFIIKFSNKDYNKPMCEYCICNSRIFTKISNHS